MADTKASAFTPTTTVASTDVFPVITTPGGTPANKIITQANLEAGLNLANQTGTAALSAASNALKSATTTVNTSSATAPTSGQVLTATSSTAATWQTPAGGGAAGVTSIFAYAHTGSMSNNTTIAWDTQLSGATLSSGVWTCSVTGVYEVIANVTFGTNPNSKDLQLAVRINGGIYTWGSANTFGAPTNGQWTSTLATPIAITSGQTLTITCNTGGSLSPALGAFYSLKQLA